MIVFKIYKICRESNRCKGNQKQKYKKKLKRTIKKIGFWGKMFVLLCESLNGQLFSRIIHVSTFI